MLLLHMHLDRADWEAGEEQKTLRGWLPLWEVHTPHKRFFPPKAAGIKEGARRNALVSFLVDLESQKGPSPALRNSGVHSRDWGQPQPE